MKSKLRILICMACALILDQAVKLWALRDLKGHGSIPIIKNVLELLYVENRGAAFGIFQNRQWLFILITCIVLAGAVIVASRIPGNLRYRPLQICLFFVCAGAVGNLIDRIGRHYVVDMIYFKLIDFPVFNVADIYVTVSVAALIFLILFYYKDEELEDMLRGR